MPRPSLGIVVPVHDECAVLPMFWARLREVCRALRQTMEVHVVFVDDASCDGSGAWLDALANAEQGVLVAHALARLGHQKALLAGLRIAPGDAVVTLDADLQDPPEVIGALAALWRSGFDVVYGVRTARPGDAVAKRATAAMYYRLLGLVSRHSTPADAGDFRLIDRRIVAALGAMPQHRPYIRGMVAQMGRRQAAYGYVRAARGAGSSSYDVAAMAKLAWAGVATCAAPWRLATLVAAIGATAVGPAVLWGLWHDRSVWGWAMAWVVAAWGAGALVRGTQSEVAAPPRRRATPMMDMAQADASQIRCGADCSVPRLHGPPDARRLQGC